MSNSQESAQGRPVTDDAVEAPKQDQSSNDRLIRAAEASTEAAEVVECIDELLDDVEERLIAGLGFEPGEIVDAAAVNARAAVFVTEYRQKGGQ